MVCHFVRCTEFLKCELHESNAIGNVINIILFPSLRILFRNLPVCGGSQHWGATWHISFLHSWQLFPCVSGNSFHICVRVFLNVFVSMCGFTKCVSLSFKFKCGNNQMLMKMSLTLICSESSYKWMFINNKGQFYFVI